MRSAKILMAMMLLAAGASATVSSVVVPKVSVAQYSNLTYDYLSTRDTVLNEIFMETGLVAGPDSTDKPLFKYFVVDNDTFQRWTGEIGYMPDGDTASGKFLFPPGPIDFPPAVYYTRLSDSDNDTVFQWTVTPYAQPYRTLSGTVSVPTGYSPANVWIIAKADSGRFSCRANTDAVGQYTIVFPDTPDVRNRSFQVGLDQEGFRQSLSYAFSPTKRLIDVSAGNITGVSFTGVPFNCLVRTRFVDDAGTALQGVMAYANDSAGHENIGYSMSDVNGVADVPLVAGAYRVGVKGDVLVGSYMLPDQMDTTVILAGGDTLKRTIVLYRTNAVIYGKVLKNGAPYNGSLTFWCRGKDFRYTTLATTDAAGLLRFDISNTERLYYGGWYDGSVEGDTILTGYTVLGGLAGYSPGDTIEFNIVQKRAITVRVSAVDRLGAPVSGAHVQISAWTGSLSVNDTTGADGVYTASLAVGNYWLGVVGGSSSVNYLLYYDSFVAGITDTENVGVLMEAADTVIYGHVNIDGKAPRRTFELQAQDPSGQYFSTAQTDSSGNFAMYVSSVMDSYNISLKLGPARADSILSTEFTLIGGLFRKAAPGDTVTFDFIGLATMAHPGIVPVASAPLLKVVRQNSTGIVRALFAVAEQSAVSMNAYDLHGKLVARIVQGNYSAGMHQAVWNTAGLGRGTYVVSVRMNRVKIVQRVIIR